MGNIENNKKRGRPFGFRLSEESKEKIRKKRLGTQHSDKTKDKISKSLTAYFKERNKLSESMEEEYSGLSDKACEWIDDNKEAINDIDCVMTDRRISYLGQLELAFGKDIENLCGHSSTPEFLIMIKEKLMSVGVDLEEFYSLI